jgi:hypothetical protein
LRRRLGSMEARRGLRDDRGAGQHDSGCGTLSSPRSPCSPSPASRLPAFREQLSAARASLRRRTAPLRAARSSAHAEPFGKRVCEQVEHCVRILAAGSCCRAFASASARRVRHARAGA